MHIEATNLGQRPIGGDDSLTLDVGSTGDRVRQVQAVVGVDQDGVYGSATKAAVMSWQTAHGLDADGVTGVVTWAAMVPAPPASKLLSVPPQPQPSPIQPQPFVPLSLQIMQRLWPHADQHVSGLIEGIVKTAPSVFLKYGLISNLTIAHAMAQFSEECGCGLEMIENMDYSASRLRQVFPTHFSSAMAERCAHNPRQIADIAYGGRMGNQPPPSDDGWNFRGRGFSQVTGREGYGKLAQKTGLPLLDHPELLSDPDYALECGVADFILCGCLPSAERDDVIGVTKHLNGGYNGLAERRRQLAIWKDALGA